jgi:hypothetical protein
VIALPVERQIIATFGSVGWWWMAKRSVGFISISQLMGA